MNRLALVISIMGLGAGMVHAQDEVYERGKKEPHKSAVTKESAKGVLLKDGTFVAAQNIEDIFYEVTPVNVRINTYRPAFAAEQESLQPGKEAKRKANIAEAIKKYQESIGKVNEPAAKRHAEFKIAALTARQALEDEAPVEPALDLLQKYKAKHPDSWQIGSALQTLARLQVQSKDFAAAAATLDELAKANVPEDLKQEAQLQMIQVNLKAGKTAEAEQMLNSVLKVLPKDSKHAARARVVQAEMLMAAKKTEEAVKLLRQVVKETDSRDLKALAYNALGESLYNRDDLKAARWEFLWVDVVYNQDKGEHAKALYYLSRIFDRLGDPEKAQECRELLLSERAFAGTEWRARAQKEVGAQ